MIIYILIIFASLNVYSINCSDYNSLIQSYLNTAKYSRRNDQIERDQNRQILKSYDNDYDLIRNDLIKFAENFNVNYMMPNVSQECLNQTSALADGLANRDSWALSRK
jgi:hypothetical protein